MKVVLLEDVKGKGKKGQLVNVSDGYARNFLLPRKLAKLADEQTLKEIKAKKESEVYRKAEEKKNALAFAEKISGSVLVFKATGGVDGRLYGAVTAKDISEKIKKDLNLDIDKRKIIVNETIKTTGQYDVEIKLYPEISAKIKLEVVN